MKQARFILLFLLCGAARPSAGGENRSLVVFPFENQSARPDLGWISESFAEVLSTRLAADHFVVARAERNAALAQLEVPSWTPLLLASQYKAAETLGVDWTVIGSFGVEGQRLTARAQWLDMREQRLRPALEVTGELAELVELQTRLAWRLQAAYDPGFTTGTEEDFRRRFPEVRLDAFENYIRGILSSDDDARLRFLTEADRLDPADHRAAFELGRYYFDHKDYANSAPWFINVVARDRDYPESLFLLGVDDFFLGKDAEAEQAFATLESTTPLREVENNLGVMETRRGDYTKALKRFSRAYEGDSKDFDFGLNLGVCLWYLKRYDEAVPYLEHAARLNDEDPAAHALLAALFGKLGNAEGQKRELDWLGQHEGTSMATVEEDILPQARLKKNFAVFRPAVAKAREEKSK